MSQKNGLIIFIKNPILGKVKTRLAKKVGEPQALTIYHKLLEHTRIVSSQVHASRYLYYSDFIDPNDHWDPEIFYKILQNGYDLGSRMYKAFIQTATPKKVIIGSDCLDITNDILEEAFKALDQFDCVIGPAKDGGYYLLGMKKVYESLFQEVDWSTDKVLNQTISKAMQLGLSIKLLTELSDIDHLEDLDNFQL